MKNHYSNQYLFSSFFWIFHALTTSFVLTRGAKVVKKDAM